MDKQTYDWKGSIITPGKSKIISLSMKDRKGEKMIEQYLPKSKIESRVTIPIKTQENDFAWDKTENKNDNIFPSVPKDEKKDALEDNRKLQKKMAADSILQKVKREVLTKHLENLGNDSRKRSPTMRDLAIQRTQPIQHLLEQEVSARVIPISAGDAFLRNMSRSPDLHKSNSSILSQNNSQISNKLSIKRIPNDQPPYLRNIGIHKQGLQKFNKKSGELYKTASEKLINDYSKDSYYNKRTGSIIEKKVNFTPEVNKTARGEDLYKTDNQKNVSIIIAEDLEDSKEFNLITEAIPDKYFKDTVVSATGVRNSTYDSFAVGDANDSKFLRKKVFYEIYGKNFSNRLSDFLLRKQKSTQQLKPKKIEEKPRDINEKMKMNQKRSKFNEDVSANILHHRNIFKGERSPHSQRSKTNPDESILSQKVNSDYDKKIRNSNNNRIISKDNSEVSFKKFDRGGNVILKNQANALNERDFISPKKLNRHDMLRIPRIQMENAAKFIQVVWREHFKIRRQCAINIQSRWRGFKLRSKLVSVIYDYYLLQNKIVNMEKLITQQFSKVFFNNLLRIYEIDKENKKNLLNCVDVIQRTFKNYNQRKKLIPNNQSNFQSQSKILHGDTNTRYQKRLMRATPPPIKERIMKKRQMNDSVNLLTKKIKFQDGKNIVLIQKIVRRYLAIKKKESLIQQELLLKQIRLRFTFEKISLSITTTPKEHLLRLTKALNKVILRNKMTEMRTYQLQDMVISL